MNGYIDTALYGKCDRVVIEFKQFPHGEGFINIKTRSRNKPCLSNISDILSLVLGCF
jgi:hypothetical protein